MPKKITINNDGVFVDGLAIPGVVTAEVKNINPGTSGAMEVVLTIRTAEVDIQYSLLRSAAKTGLVSPLQSP